MRLEIRAVPGIPEIASGDDLGAVIAAALEGAGLDLVAGDIVVVASKIVAKAEGLRRFAARDSVIAEETVRVVAERHTGDRVTRVVEGVAGPVMAAAGVDESNLGAEGGVLVLPRDPDAAAATVLAGLRAATGLEGALGVVVSDTAGRPWRGGVVDFALGSAGVQVVDDHRGGVDADGRPLTVTVIAVADEIAAAADLVKGKASGAPVALVRGLRWASPSPDEPGASTLVRTGPGDWFATGPVEAVRAALGVAPGSPASEEVGIRSVAPEPLSTRVERVRRLALHEAPAEVSCSTAEATLTFSASEAYGLGVVVTRAEVGAASEDLATVVERLSPLSARLSFREIQPGR